MKIGETPEVYIVVLNWNGWKDTIECVQSLKKLSYNNYTIIIVDNASTDGSVDHIYKMHPEIKIIELKQNNGYAAGNNAGIRYALDKGAKYVWVLNNDTIVEEEALAPLVKIMEDEHEIGICGSKLIYYHQRNEVQALGGGRYNKWLGITRTIGNRQPSDIESDRRKIEKRMDFIVGASIFVSRRFIETVGLMNEEYFLYYEEMDWATRGQKEFRLGFAPGSVVYHKHGVSVNSGKEEGDKRSKLADFYQIRNRLRFCRKYYPQYLPFIYFTVLYAALARAASGKWDRAEMIFKLMFTYNK